MPAIVDTSARILVTGANGFLGTWIVQELLDRGYCVRAAVRAVEKGEFLTAKFANYRDRLELIIVGDIAEEHALDRAVEGVDGIIHTASPVTTFVDNPDDVIRPAVRGVTGILESALKHGTSVQRVVLTSSCAAILDTSDEQVTVSEADWNDQRVEECKAFGRRASGLSKYSASKTLAERAAWEFMATNKHILSWDMAVINPPYIFGPVLHDVKDPLSLNSSSKLFYDAVVHNDYAGVSPLESPSHGWVDVRDVAAAHVKALETPGAGGERIIVSAGEWVWQDMINAALTLPRSIYKPHCAVTGPKEVKSRLITFNTEKEKQVLGLTFRPLEDLVRDILLDYMRRGWYP